MRTANAAQIDSSIHKSFGNPNRATHLAQVICLEALAYKRMLNCGKDNAAFSRLALAWAALEDRRCRLKGIPNPGQLRPDLDPVQLKRAMKRANVRHISDVMGNATALAAPTGEVCDESAQLEAPTPEPTPEPEAPQQKESL